MTVSFSEQHSQYLHRRSQELFWRGHCWSPKDRNSRPKAESAGRVGPLLWMSGWSTSGIYKCTKWHFSESVIRHYCYLWLRYRSVVKVVPSSEHSKDQLVWVASNNTLLSCCTKYIGYRTLYIACRRVRLANSGGTRVEHSIRFI